MSKSGAKKAGEGVSRKEKKGEYFNRLIGYLREYRKILIVLCDNIGSKHMQRIRITLRGKAVLLMGKNTMMRKVIREHLEENPAWEGLLEHITGNVGLVFTNDPDLRKIKDICLESKVPAAAKAGIKAPQEVIIPKGVTTLEPTKTSFLQALNIATKINKGSIEILQDVLLIKKGDKVGSSESTLLQMLDIRPFQYGLVLVAFYEDGVVVPGADIDITDDVILSKFVVAVGNVTSLALGLGIPTVASFPHVVANAFKNVLAIALETSFSFPQADKIKEILENPEAYAAAGPATSAATATTTTTTTTESAPDPEPEPEEEEEVVDFDLFG